MNQLKKLKGARAADSDFIKIIYRMMGDTEALLESLP
jgi:hypothetical protein